MNIELDDIIMFYTLKQHFDIISTNIGITGDNRRFKRYVLRAYKSIKNKHKQIYSNETKTKYTILNDGMEITFIHIRTTEDLQGKYFRKFI